MSDRSDVEDFERVALAHLDALYRVALRWTRSRADAEDVVQDTYVRAFRSFHRFNPGTNCRAWLFTIMRNVFLSRVDSRSREVLVEDTTALVDRPDAAIDASTMPVSPEEGLLQTVLHGDVERALGALPAQFQHVVVLVDLEGLSYREAADVLGCPIGTVMSRLFRGRGLLKRALGRLGREHGYVKEE